LSTLLTNIDQEMIGNDELTGNKTKHHLWILHFNTLAADMLLRGFIHIRQVPSRPPWSVDESGWRHNYI